MPPRMVDTFQQTILKSSLEAIPLLTIENFSLWRNRIENLLDLQGLTESLISDEGQLSDIDNVNIRTILTSKLDSSIHLNIINHDNEKDAKAIWKSISKYFASSEASNRARIFKELLHIDFDVDNITEFITSIRLTISRMHKVGINIPEDIIAYLILEKLPPSMDTISQQITHSDKLIHPETVLDHLRLFNNDKKLSNVIKNENTSLFTTGSSFVPNPNKCKIGKHNPKSNHSPATCFFLHPKLRSNCAKPNSNHQMVSFNLARYPFKISKNCFVLDSGSSDHMICDANLFSSLTLHDKGIVKTEANTQALKVKGFGTVRILGDQLDLEIANALYVPGLSTNLLSVRSLLLMGLQAIFLVNSFSISRNETAVLSGSYRNNLPIIRATTSQAISFLSYSEKIHKSLGHVSYH